VSRHKRVHLALHVTMPDGTVLPADDASWVIRRTCGCISAASVVYHRDHLGFGFGPILTAEDFHKDLRPNRARRDRELRHGWTITLEPHTTADQIFAPCPDPTRHKLPELAIPDTHMWAAGWRKPTYHLFPTHLLGIGYAKVKALCGTHHDRPNPKTDHTGITTCTRCTRLVDTGAPTP
jgi:hypothetical protein